MFIVHSLIHRVLISIFGFNYCFKFQGFMNFYFTIYVVYTLGCTDMIKLLLSYLCFFGVNC